MQSRDKKKGSSYRHLFFSLFALFLPLKGSVGRSHRQVQKRMPFCHDNLIHRHLRVASQAISVRMCSAFNRSKRQINLALMVLSPHPFLILSISQSLLYLPPQLLSQCPKSISQAPLWHCITPDVFLNCPGKSVSK